MADREMSAGPILIAAGAEMHAQAMTRASRVWRHKKRGSIYTILGCHLGVVYYVAHGDGKRWWRPAAEFADGRFEPLPDAMPLTPAEAGFERG